MTGWEVVLSKQSELEKQYQVLKDRNYSDRDIAFHLARFSEAFVYNSAYRYIEKIENDLRTLRNSQTRDGADS